MNILANLRRPLALVLMMGLMFFAQGSALARDIVSTSFTTPNVDLIQVLERARTGETELQIELPADSSGTFPRMTAVAQGPGNSHQWGVFSLRNQDPVPRDLVLTTLHRGFVGSGLLWPAFGGARIMSVQSSPGLQPVKLNSANMDAYHFRINPGETITYAIEWVEDAPASLRLWKRGSYDTNLQRTATFYGMLLGFSLLLLIAIICLFVIRPRMVFPAGALFVGASLVFLAGEFGYLDGAAQFFPAVPDLSVRVRAIAEALMGAGLVACLITFVELRKRLPLVWPGVAILLILAFTIAAWAWFDPLRAAGCARITFVFASVTSLICAATLIHSKVIRAKASVAFFTAALLWTLVAITAVFEILDPGLLKLAVTCGLILLMAIATLTLGRFAFNQGVIHSRFFEDSGRRALALAGSEQCVWDWNEERSTLHIGPELERALGYSPLKITKGGLKSWMSIIHPADRSSYISGIEAAIGRGRGTLKQQFRLRKSDGTYRWYELRGRALPGDQDRASRCIGTLSDITTSKRAEDSLLFDAVHDRITRLPNRALFIDRLQRAMRREISRSDGKLAILVVDLDRFKNVNDGFGHPVGDSLLLTMARRLRGFAEPDDSLARIAGNQFGLIVNAANPRRDVTELANTIRETLAQPIEINSREVFLTASIGITEFNRDTEIAEDVLKDAEIALYEAKRRGSNTIEVFNPAMRDDRSEFVHLEAELQRALERNEIEVMFQPITRLQDLELAGFEALVRWRHGQRGLLTPDEFLDVAEETGLISEMGEFVLNEAARQLGIWQRAFRPKHPLFVAVNLSHSQVLGRGLVDEVKAILDREDLAPGTFKIEITESMLMENPELSIQILDRLKRLGVGLSCDDFGTGYSSLAMLERLPFDTLKLDKTFLEPDADNDAAAIILETVINLAHDLRLEVVAEGVENKDQVERLRVLECDLAQGFHFGEPMTSRKVIETLGGSPFLLSRQGAGDRTTLLKRVFDGRRNREPDSNVFVTKPNIDPGANILNAPSRSRVPPSETARFVPPRSPLAEGQQQRSESLEDKISSSPTSGDEAARSAVVTSPPPRDETPPVVHEARRMDLPVPGASPEQPNESEPPPLPQPGPLLRARVLPPPAARATEISTPADDFRQIVGVGDTIRNVLHNMNIMNYAQIAELSDEDAEVINGRIGFAGRVQQDLWVDQARDLAAGKTPWSKGAFEAAKETAALNRAQAADFDVQVERVDEPEVLPRPPIPKRPAEGEEPDESDIVEDAAEVVVVGEPVANDLTKINGIGPAINRDLNDMNIVSYAQLAALDDERAEEINNRIGFPGRIQREKWREQAAALITSKTMSVQSHLSVEDRAPKRNDDISLIGGIGPAIARDLAELGIVSFEQMSKLSNQQVLAINEKIGFPGRVEREQWREQARELMAGLAPRAKIDREAMENADLVEQELSAASEEELETPQPADDLTRIKGVGPALAKVLNDAGVYSFSALAALDDEKIAALEKEIGFPGRIERDQWRQQAQEFVG
jgi:diguanylate cyclase (GGDEF)-like protein/PAS domain S-box-containing protein